MKGADPAQDLTAEARVIDTQGRIARVAVEVKQGDKMISRLTEMVFLRKVD
jgi:acyl-coenzyme A thioesterase PaaI-like protein